MNIPGIIAGISAAVLMVIFLMSLIVGAIMAEMKGKKKK